MANKAKAKDTKVSDKHNIRSSEKRGEKKSGPAKSPENRSTGKDGRDIENPT